MTDPLEPCTVRDLSIELERWRSVALYLADCHAGTAEWQCMLKKTGKSEKNRHRAICRKALDMIEGRDHPRQRSGYEGVVKERLAEVLERHGEPEVKPSCPASSSSTPGSPPASAPTPRRTAGRGRPWRRRASRRCSVLWPQAD